MRTAARAAATILALIALLSCSRGHIDRAEWQRMSHDDRVLYVSSLIGAQKVKDAKGGGGKTYDAPPEHYVSDIDAAYARGDHRDPEEIFEGLSR